MPGIGAKPANTRGRQQRETGYGLHPLLDRNASTLREQRFSKTLTGGEFFLAEHRIDGHPTLPAACYLEMARAAGEAALEKEINRITNIAWERPVRFAGVAVELDIRLFPEENGVAFEIQSRADGGERVVHARGKIHPKTESTPEDPSMDPEAMIREFSIIRDGEACYRSFHHAGLDYGPAFQPIETLYCKEREAISRLKRPPSVNNDFRQYALHPSMMDGALQTVSGLMGRYRSQSVYLPFVAGEVIWSGSFTERCYVHAVEKEPMGKENRIIKLDITVMDDAGRPLIVIRDYAVKAIGRKSAKARETDSRTLAYLRRLSAGEMTIDEVKEKIRI
jgi:acyl transferase domain-containing protein